MQYTFTRVHARIPNAHSREEHRARASEKSADKSARILVRVRLGQTGSTTAADCQLWQAERTTRRHSRDDPCEDVGVGAMEFQLKLSSVEFRDKRGLVLRNKSGRTSGASQSHGGSRLAEKVNSGL